jgi:hypothetical protein
VGFTGRCDPRLVAARTKEGTTLLNVALTLCELQLKAGRFFLFEHPGQATTWGLPRVAALKARTGVMAAVFDQCCYGACTKILNTPVLKNTMFLTNSKVGGAKGCPWAHHDYGRSRRVAAD